MPADDLRDQLTAAIREIPGPTATGAVDAALAVFATKLAELEQQITEYRNTQTGLLNEREEQTRRAVAAETERDLLRETLAETDLGALTLAQWEAIADADADRDRLETERDALKAAIRHHAAEAHRRKWAHQSTSPAAFDELHRLGNELLDPPAGAS
ncbi:hypothetical protein NE236_41850 [Actinoallomurus purpureus]|uniref:hypothetical protein n=1 Tax=Actinoallomurus purpureus TaxID=478114 RepID=UPI002093A01E|nr:hypothetical protein [Actinoallomurus purpureus]MCO6011515.1 hypothetical protein [Actinoallomurus purpureus]